MASLAKNSEKQVKLQEKYQAILSAMLREEDNKYCVDCDAKGPRWASWNLGVFLCIRCAGIHRNLGVHISKVKSVNLDQWTAEQIAVNYRYLILFYFVSIIRKHLRGNFVASILIKWIDTTGIEYLDCLMSFIFGNQSTHRNLKS